MQLCIPGPPLTSLRMRQHSPGRGKFRLRLANDNEDKVILNLKNVYYLPSSPSNLVSLALLNDHGIYYNNEKERLYEKSSGRICWNTS